MDIEEAKARFAEIKRALGRWTGRDRISGVDRSASELKAIFEDIESRVLIELNSLYRLLKEDFFRFRHKLQAQGTPKLEACKAAEKAFPLLQEHVGPTLEKTESRVAVVRGHIGKLETLRDEISKFVRFTQRTIDDVLKACPGNDNHISASWKRIAADLACWAQDMPIDYWLHTRDNRSFLFGRRNGKTIDSALEDDFNQILLGLRLLPQGTAGDIAKPLKNERDSLVTHIEELRIPPPTIALSPADPSAARRVDDRDANEKRPVDYLVDEIAGLLEVPTHCRIACEKVAKLRNGHPVLMRWGVDKLRCPSSARLGLQEGASWPPPEEILMLFRYGLVVAVHDFTQESREKRLHFDKSQEGGAVETDFDLAARLAAECADKNAAFRHCVYEALEKVRDDLKLLDRGESQTEVVGRHHTDEMAEGQPKLPKRGKGVLSEEVEKYLEKRGNVPGIPIGDVVTAINTQDIVRHPPTSRESVAITVAWKKYSKDQRTKT